MKISRRGFFATLVAPLIAKVIPKPRSPGPTPFFIMESTARGADHWYWNMFLKSRQLGYSSMIGLRPLQCTEAQFFSTYREFDDQIRGRGTL